MPSRQLRISPRKNTNDPFENEEFIFGGVVGGMFNEGYDKQDSTEEEEDFINRQSLKVKEKINMCRQTSFCMNDIRSSSEKERYGFLKPRMWDQYADNYKGVCLAFSKEKLSEVIKPHDQLEGEISYEVFETKKYKYFSLSIDLTELRIIGYEEYERKTMEELNKFFFHKHKDYAQENEYRICVFSKQKDVYIDITESIRGVVILENYITASEKETVKKYAKELNIEVLSLYFVNNDVMVN